ncbi:hypothetical protein [Pseudoroseomonas sp. WGS1072]
MPVPAGARPEGAARCRPRGSAAGSITVGRRVVAAEGGAMKPGAATGW